MKMAANNKILNKKQRLRATIFGAGVISRKELVEKTGLNYRSVIAYAEELKQQKLIVEDIRTPPDDESRPSIHYVSNCGRLYCLGIMSYRRTVTLAAADVNSNIFHVSEIVLDENAAAVDAAGQVSAAVDRIQELFRHRTLAGIEICRFPYARKENCYEGMKELCLSMRRHCRIPVFLHTSYDALLLHMARNFNISGRTVLLCPGDTICLAMVEDGQINENMENYARRFRHHPLSAKADDKCSCGKRGCVENLLTHGAAIRRYIRLGESEGRLFRTPEDIAALHMLAAGGAAAARQTLEESGRLFAEALWFLKNDLQADQVLLNSRNPFVNSSLYERYRELAGTELPPFSAFRATMSDVLSACLEIPLSRLIP